MIRSKTIRDLTFTKFRSPSLPSFVRDIMEVQGHSVKTSKRLFPKNTPEILINLSRPIYGRMEDEIASVEKCTIQGSKTCYVNALHPKHCHFLSIRFSPNGCYKLFGMDQNEFTDQVFNLDEVINEKHEAVITALQSAESPKQRFQILSAWLRKKTAKKDIPTNLVSDFIITQLQQNPDTTVRELVQKTGYTRKHLVQRFKEEAGLTIKEYQKVLRIFRVLKSINATDDISWAGLACCSGFYDQSHFIKDFKKYTGFTPTQYTDQLIPQKSIAS